MYFKFMNKVKIFLCAVLLPVLANVFAAEVSSGQTLEAATYQIRNVRYGELLRPKDANSADGTPIVLYPAQLWKCMAWQLKPGGDPVDGTNAATVFRIKNLFTSKTFHADAGAGTNASQQRVTQLRFPKDGSSAPGWRFVRLDDGSYEILDAKSGSAITAMKEEGAYEARIVTMYWQNLDNQKWRLEKIDPKDLTM